jgi:hypothetical protein
MIFNVVDLSIRRSKCRSYAAKKIPFVGFDPTIGQCHGYQILNMTLSDTGMIRLKYFQ